MNYNAYPWGRWIKWIVAAVVLIILLSSSVSTYNSLVKLDQQVQKQWSQVENVMQSRLDKITNMVEVVKGYTKHEEKVFGDIAEARSVINSTNSDVASKLNADERLTTAARSLILMVENYPDLKASQQFHDLQVAIEGAENRIANERRFFINAVESYNTKVRMFPGSLFARFMGFEPKEYFKADSEAQEAPKIQF